MLKLWYLLVYGYIPKYEIIQETILVDRNDEIIGQLFILRCEVTGHIKYKRIYGNSRYI